MVSEDESNGKDDDATGNEVGECDWDREEWRFLFRFAFVAIAMTSIAGSDGNRRQRASAQRGSISFREIRTNRCLQGK